LISAVDGGEWSASRPGRFAAGERAVGAHWTAEYMFLLASFVLFAAMMPPKGRFMN
jgi:hypothetical protein